MKIILKYLNFFLFLLLMCQSNEVVCNKIAEQFFEAAQLYQKGDFISSLQLYNAILNKGPVLYYNIALCQYSMHDYVASLASLMRSEYSGASAGLLLKNKQLRALIYDALGKINQNSFIDIIYHMIHTFSIFTLQIIFLVSLLLIVCMRIMLWPKMIQLLLSFFMVIILILLVSRYVVSNIRQAYVVDNNVILYAGPDTLFHVVNSIGYAEKIYVMDIHNDWCLVKKEHCSGWIEKKSLDIIDVV